MKDNDKKYVVNVTDNGTVTITWFFELQENQIIELKQQLNKSAATKKMWKVEVIKDGVPRTVATTCYPPPTYIQLLCGSEENSEIARIIQVAEQIAINAQ